MSTLLPTSILISNKISANASNPSTSVPGYHGVHTINIRLRICYKIMFKNICNQVFDFIVNLVTVNVNPVTKKFSIALFATTILHYLCFVQSINKACDFLYQLSLIICKLLFCMIYHGNVFHFHVNTVT